MGSKKIIPSTQLGVAGASAPAIQGEQEMAPLDVSVQQIATLFKTQGAAIEMPKLQALIATAVSLVKGDQQESVKYAVVRSLVKNATGRDYNVVVTQAFKLAKATTPVFELTPANVVAEVHQAVDKLVVSLVTVIETKGGKKLAAWSIQHGSPLAAAVEGVIKEYLAKNVPW